MYAKIDALSKIWKYLALYASTIFVCLGLSIASLFVPYHDNINILRIFAPVFPLVLATIVLKEYLIRQIKDLKDFFKYRRQRAEEFAKSHIERELSKCIKSGSINIRQLDVLLKEVKNALNDGVDIGFINKILSSYKPFPCSVRFVQNVVRKHFYPPRTFYSDLNKGRSTLELIDSKGKRMESIILA